MRSTVRTLVSFAFATLVGLLATSAPSFAAQAPFSGTPALIPGAIEAENFDLGGEGEAYHDSTAANEPGAYRNEGVDVEAQGGTFNGYDVGWVTPGEWLEYTVNVSDASALYTIRIRHASAGPGGTMHVEFNGVDKTGPITLDDSGGWLTWRYTDVSGVALSLGQQVMRLAFDSGNADGWLANIDRIEVVTTQSAQTPWNGQVHSLPIRIEAEDYDLGGEGIAYHDTTPENEPGAYRRDGVDIEVTSDEGGGYDVGWVRPGEWLEYTVRGDAPYSLQIRHASQGPGGTIHIERDGRDISGPIVLPDTGGWQNWQTTRSPRPISMPDGSWTMRVVFDEPGPDGWLANINYIDVKRGPGHCCGGPPRSIPGTIEAENFDFGGEGVAYHDTSAENEGGAANNRPPNEGVDVEITSDAGGGYDVGWIQPGEWIIYSLGVRESGTYAIDIRAAAQGSGGKMHIEFDGADVTGPIILPDTGGWQTWQTVTVPNVKLRQDGGDYMRLVFDEGNADGWLANINWVRFTRTGP